jgi:hypothetical protein
MTSEDGRRKTRIDESKPHNAKPMVSQLKI